MEYRLQQVASILGISRQAVQSLVHRRRLDAIMEDKKWLVSSGNLLGYIMKRREEVAREEKKLNNCLLRVQ